jgi:hypothetical protein
MRTILKEIYTKKNFCTSRESIQGHAIRPIRGLAAFSNTVSFTFWSSTKSGRDQIWSTKFGRKSHKPGNGCAQRAEMSHFWKFYHRFSR